jgi:hypothetical protein
MTWPTVAISTTNLDAGTDSPASARADLLDAVNKSNQMIAHVSPFMATLLDDATAGAARTTLGVTNSNGLINGDFSVWQRGTSLTPAVGYAYTADRWLIYSQGAAPSSVTQTVNAPDGNMGFGLLANGAASNQAISFIQRVEALNTLQYYGNTVVVSGWVYTSDTRSVDWSVLSCGTTNNFTTGTTALTRLAGNASSATGWRFVWAQFSAPGNRNGLQVIMGFGATLAGVSVAISKVQLEAGTTFGPFQWRKYAEELALCHRYYRRTEGGGAYNYSEGTVFGYATAGALIGCTLPFPTVMIGTPVVSVIGTFTYSNCVRPGSIGADTGSWANYLVVTATGYASCTSAGAQMVFDAEL